MGILEGCGRVTAAMTMVIGTLSLCLWSFRVGYGGGFKFRVGYERVGTILLSCVAVVVVTLCLSLCLGGCCCFCSSFCCSCVACGSTSDVARPAAAATGTTAAAAAATASEDHE